jgi:diguanylate cyclase (GGDEF)-like protein
MATALVAEQPAQGFKTRVLLPVLTVTVAAVLFAALGVFWAATRSDAISVERQVRETRQAIGSTLDELALHQELIAVSDDLVLELRKPEPDWQRFDDSIGVWLRDLFIHDEVYILNGKNSPIYAMVNGVREEASHFADIDPDVEHVIGGVRGHVIEDNNTHQRLPGRPLNPSNTVRTSDKAVHGTELMSVRGRPAAVSIMRIVPLTDKVSQAPGAEPLLVSIRFLDNKFLHDLSRHSLIEAPRISHFPDLAIGEHAWPIDSDHEMIGYFIWRPELPGTALMHALAPVTGLSIGVLMIIMARLAFWLHREMREKQDTILQLQASEAQAQHLAFHDALTGLPNRAKFNDRTDKAVARARHGKPVAILLLDLDRFKHVNDTLGHLAGDALIRDFGERLLQVADDEDTVARLGGDEFAILRCKASSHEEIAALCERILEAVRPAFNLLGNSAFVGVSVGVSIAPELGSERVDLMRKADIALYRAKAEGRDCYRLFTPAMDEGVKLRSTIEEDLRTALATGDELRVHYQPQVAGPGQAIVGLEALVRWQHPRLGLIAPEHFIPVAEETGLICQLGEWMLRRACAASRRWPDLFIAVNLSPVQFRTPGFADRLIAIVRSTSVDPQRIELEVTEGLLLDDSDIVSDALKRLRAAGFRIALDDFGTGYSSLSYLRRFEVDKIKIDRSFVQHLGQTVDSTAIISAVLTLGHAMGLTVTAEGVETAAQCDFLEAAGCNAMQGYLFSRPLPEEEVDHLISIGKLARGVA